MEKNKKEPEVQKVLKYHPSDIVERAVRDSELVLSYISEAGIEADRKDIEVITKTKEALDTNNWNRQIEEDFWIAFRNLTNKIKPVSVDSLKAVHEQKILHPTWWQRLWKKEYKTSVAFRSVRFYTILVIFFMIIMLIIHIYFSIGTIRLNKIQLNEDQISQVEKQINDLELMSAGSEDNLGLAFKKDKLFTKLYELNQEKESNIKLLYEWLRLAKSIFFWKDTEEHFINAQTENLEAEAPTSPEQVISFHISTINEAGNYLLVLGFYILPLLYGFLGAMAFVLRELRDQIKNMTFTKEMNINFTLRLILGTIVGLAVGVFWSEIRQQESLKFIQTISQLLAAFLAGLAVEYIFRFIERAINFFLEKAFIFNKKDNDK